MAQRTQTQIDPVCGMTVDSAKAAAIVEQDGTRHFFCSQGCAPPNSGPNRRNT